MNTLLIVDGTSYLYRAFYGLPPLNNRHNQPTGAIYGVVSMLKRLQKDWSSNYSVCVFDAKGKTFRNDIYPNYKAHRALMPDDLRLQVEPLFDTVKALGWPVLRIDGVEADDVIGTLAVQAERQGFKVVIATGDKDIAQLVSPNVTLVNTMRNETLDEKGVLHKFGVPPARIIDYLALVGDTADNVPGVSKVGPKTAVKWLDHYGSLDALIDRSHEIGGGVGTHLRAAIPWLATARRLVTIRCDIDLPCTLLDLSWRTPDLNALARLYETFDFKAWLDELTNTPSLNASAGMPMREKHYHTIFTPSDFDRLVAELERATLICLDTETTSLDSLDAQIVGLSFSTQPGHAVYLPLAHSDISTPPQLNRERCLKALQPILEDANHSKLGQNIKYDCHVLANHGIVLRGIAHDTLLESYVLESHQRHGLDALAKRHLNWETITFESLVGKGAKQIPFYAVPIVSATEYAAEDADVTLQLHLAMQPRIRSDVNLNRVYQTLEIPLVEVLVAMERNGVLIDVAMLGTQSLKLEQRLSELEKQAYTLAGHGFNLSSPQQLQKILFEELGITPLRKTPSGAPSTDEDVLQVLAGKHALPKVLLEHRSLAKLKSTYTDKLPRMLNAQTGRIHTHYNQAVTMTGRLSSTDPNLQNIPVRSLEGRRIREAFIAPAGRCIVSADYSQIELRIMAHLSQDAGLLNAFAKGEDIHRATAAEIFGVSLDSVTDAERRAAKTINFGLIYGMSAFGLAQSLDISRAAAQQYMTRYFERYSGVQAYMQNTRERARQNGYVETLLGRRLWTPAINDNNAMRRAGAERAAINAPMQGTAADIIKLAMIAVQNWLWAEQRQSLLIMQVHDELVLEVPDQELDEIKTMLQRLMQNVIQLDVPLLVEVGVGKSWEAAH
ncbi:MAG: DNA polymerase I [Methylophilaceae bacterium]|nr:DNA polymerase I [Methylophilaceae bacterium]